MKRVQLNKTLLNTSCLIYTFLAVLFIHYMAGCSKQQPPTVSEMYAWNISDFSNQELKDFLDRSNGTEEYRREYWTPMMVKLVNGKNAGQYQETWIPMDHLQEAINQFNKTGELNLQEPAVYVYYWQLYSDLPTRKSLYGYGPAEEKEKRTYLRKYLPALFERHKFEAGASFEPFAKMYRLVKLHDPLLVQEIFEDNPFPSSQ